ncbi:hypothetical protein C8Q78DRAFT_994520 [Trametes maxima]|nr:hypothetical protein C8Q78DRAFT_994520 [Trametes maxima]
MLRALVQSLSARALTKALFPLLCLWNQYFAFYYLSTFFNSFASSDLVKNWLNASSFELEENWWSCGGFSWDKGGDAGDVAAISRHSALLPLRPHPPPPHPTPYLLSPPLLDGFRSFWACLVRILKTYKGIPSPQNNLRLSCSLWPEGSGAPGRSRYRAPCEFSWVMWMLCACVQRWGVQEPDMDLGLGSSTIVTGVMNAQPPVFIPTDNRGII